MNEAKKSMIVGQTDREELISQFNLTRFWPGDRVIVNGGITGKIVALRQLKEEGDAVDGEPNYLLVVKADVTDRLIQASDLEVEYIKQ